jgi:hypothetical protein
MAQADIAVARRSPDAPDPTTSKTAVARLSSPAPTVPLVRTKKDLVRTTKAGTPEPDVCGKTLGVRHKKTGLALYRQLASLNPWVGKAEGEEVGDRFEAAVAMLDEFRPKNALQAMLLVQMVSVHHAGTHYLLMANRSGSIEVVERYTRIATRFMRLFVDQMDAWGSLQGKRGRQRMTVKHVHVHPGGHAIVGAVNVPKEAIAPRMAVRELPEGRAPGDGSQS